MTMTDYVIREMDNGWRVTDWPFEERKLVAKSFEEAIDCVEQLHFSGGHKPDVAQLQDELGKANERICDLSTELGEAKARNAELLAKIVDEDGTYWKDVAQWNETKRKEAQAILARVRAALK